MELNKTITNEIEQAVLCWLATVDSNGIPSVSPKEIWKKFGDNRVVVADIASSNSVENIRTNPKVCLSFIDIFRQRGFKLYGTARIVPKSEPEFLELGADLLMLAGEKFDIRNVLEIEVFKASPIVAPSYKLFPGTSEEDMKSDAYETYGVRPS